MSEAEGGGSAWATALRCMTLSSAHEVHAIERPEQVAHLVRVRCRGRGRVRVRIGVRDRVGVMTLELEYGRALVGARLAGAEVAAALRVEVAVDVRAERADAHRVDAHLVRVRVRVRAAVMAMIRVGAMESTLTPSCRCRAGRTWLAMAIGAASAGR